MTLIHDLPLLSTDELIHHIAAHLHTSDLAKAAAVLAVGEYGNRAHTRADDIEDCTGMLIRHCGQSKSSANEMLRVGKILLRHPEAAEAFLRGAFSYSAARILTRYLTAANVDELIALAQSLTCAELADELSGRERPDAVPTPESVTWRRNADNGTTTYTIVLNAENAADFEAALKLGQLSFLRSLTAEDRTKSPAELDAAIGDATSTEHCPGVQESEGKPELLPAISRFGEAAKKHALAGLLAVIKMVRAKGQSTRRSPGAQTHVLIDTERLARLAYHPEATPSLVENMIFNSSVVYHLLDDDGVTQLMTRPRRLFDNAQATALLAKWGFQCAMPGCNHSMFMQFHHVKDYADGGETSIANGLPLCSYCHSLVTDGTITIHVDPADSAVVHFRFPGGRSFSSYSRQRPRRNPDLGPGDTYDSGPVPHGDESHDPHREGDHFDD
ncbi:HNH endonuclease signature motif containing protein [Corynebacterium uterequi]|uniref:HNH endonuclease n=1 Tax=Corynebacterium uterequi TaxID=1072256 RepID=A0A0G3HJY1_9CORY|nr:HNH endonuclease signature motif containing protein [Corynebacterium uterequi]AKK11447.1 HNH endonuclease [Corynebacterium uterequi]